MTVFQRMRSIWARPALRDFRGGDGNVGIIRSPVRAIVLLDRTLAPCFSRGRRLDRSLDGGRNSLRLRQKHFETIFFCLVNAFKKSGVPAKYPVQDVMAITYPVTQNLVLYPLIMSVLERQRRSQKGKSKRHHDPLGLAPRVVRKISSPSDSLDKQ